MKRILCSIVTQTHKLGDYYVEAYLAAPGLAVHRTTDGGKLLSGHHGWRITHILSGYSVAYNRLFFQTKKEAARFARLMAEEIDWSSKQPLCNGKTPHFDKHIQPVIDRFNAGHDPGG